MNIKQDRFILSIPDGYSKICGSCGERHGYPETGPRELDWEMCHKCAKGKTCNYITEKEKFRYSSSTLKVKRGCQ